MIRIEYRMVRIGMKRVEGERERNFKEQGNRLLEHSEKEREWLDVNMEWWE